MTCEISSGDKKFGLLLLAGLLMAEAMSFPMWPYNVLLGVGCAFW